MIVNISGLTFYTASPSEYELISVRRDVDPTAVVKIRYNGFKWWIDYQSPNGSIRRPFPSRDAAIQLIADRAAP